MITSQTVAGGAGPIACASHAWVASLGTRMNLFSKRIVLNPDNPLFKKIYPVLLDIFCRGVLAADSKQLMLGSALSILTSPAGWVVLIFRKLPHLVIITIVWWLLGTEIRALGVSEHVLLALAFIAIFYMELVSRF